MFYPLLVWLAIVIPASASAADLATLVGTITDYTSGAPLSGAVVQVKLGSTVVASTTTNSSGDYSIVVGQSTYDIFASKTGYGAAVLIARRLLPNHTTTVNFALQREGSITGTVTDVRTGIVLQGVTIQALQGTTLITSTTTASNGTYSLTGLAPGSYTVTAARTNYTTGSQSATVATNQTTTLNFGLLPTPGTIAGNVQDSSAIPPSGLNGVSIAVRQAGSIIAMTTTDTSGNYSIAGIYPGTNYSVEASLANYITQAQSPITVTSNTTTVVNFTLAPQAGTLSGTTIDQVTSLGLQNVLIEVLQGSSFITSTTTGVGGSYTISGLTAANYTVRASLSNYQTQNSPATIHANQTTTVNFALQPYPGSISGTVTDTSASPVLIQGATVQALQGSAVVGTTVTAADGSYLLAGLVPGTYTVQATAPHYGMGSLLNVPVTPGGMTSNQDFALTPNTGALSGTVTHAVSGAPLPDVVISIVQGATPITSTTTNANGTYYVPNLMPGNDYSVTASLPHYETTTSSPVTISSDATLTVNFALNPNPGTISGSVTPVPVEGATIEALQGNSVIASTTILTAGPYTLPNLAPGIYTVRVTATGYQTMVAVNTVVQSDQTTTVDFTLQSSPGTIAGTVTDSGTHIGISGAAVQALQGSVVIALTTTLGDGSFSLPNLAPGTYSVRATATDYQTVASNATVVAATTTTVNFSLLANPGTISGTVTTTLGGSSIEGALVEVFQGTTLITSTTTNASGAYSLPGLAPGTYDVQASATSYQTRSQTGVTVTSGATTIVDIALAPMYGTIAGTVRDSGGPLDGATVTVLEGGVTIATTTTTGGGNYTINNIPPGSYTVRASQTNYQTAVVGAIVQSTQTTTVNFTLMPSPGSIEGAVSDSQTHLGISGATVEALQGFVVLASTTTAGDGTYTLSDLASGTYLVRVSAAGYQTTTIGATVVSNIATTVNFSLFGNPGTIAGVVRTSVSLTPIDSALIEISQGNASVASTLTDGLGQYSVPGMAPGTYFVRAIVAGYQIGSASAIVLSGETTTIDFALLSPPGGITGQITNAVGGSTIPSTEIAILQGGAVVASTMTDSNGVYTVSTLAPGSYTVQAHAASFQNGSQTATIVAGQTAIVNIALAPSPATITGHVTDTSVPPHTITGATIAVLDNGIAVATTVTETDGSYTISGLPPGTYLVRASSPLFETASAGASVSPGGTATVDFALQSSPGFLTGTVTDSATHLAIASVSIDLFQGSTLVASTTTDANGTYRIDGLSSGSYTARATATLYQAQSLGAILTSGAETTVDFVLAVNPGTIYGTVMDQSTGQPLPNITVEVFQDTILVASTQTDIDGNYSIGSLAPGTYTVLAKDGYQTQILGATVGAGEHVLVSFQLLANPGTINGTVVAASNPVGGATVDLLQETTILASTMTSSDGTYTLSGLPPGTYTIRVTHAGYQIASVGGTVTAGATTTVDISLLSIEGTLSGHVQTELLTSIGGATIEVIEGTNVVASTTTNPQGDYVILNLAPQTYTVRAGAVGYQISTQTTTIVTSSTTTVNFTLSADVGAIQGTVTSSLGVPIPGAGLTIMVSQESTPVAETVTGADGSYRVSNIAPGTYTIEARATHFQTSAQGAVIESGHETTVDFVLQAAPGSLVGTVIDAVGPLAGARIDVVQDSTVVATTLTSTNGTYTIDGLAPADYLVRASYTDHETAIQSATIIASQTTTANFVLLTSPGAIDGSVYDDAAIPNKIPNAAIDLFQNSTLIASTRSDANALFLFPNLRPAFYTVRAAASGFSTQTIGATVQPLAHTTITFHLQSNPGSIFGIVTDALLTPLSGATVEAIVGTSVISSTLTSATGAYTLTGLYAGTYNVTVRVSLASYSSQTQTVTVTSGIPTELNFILSSSQGTLIGQVLNGSTSLPVAGAEISLSQGLTYIGSVTTNSFGNYTFGNLSPGQYTVRASAADLQTSFVAGTIVANESTAVNFVLQPNPGTVQGTVTSGGSPIGNATVRVQQNNTIVSMTTTDTHGDYIISGLAPGTYLVTITASGYQGDMLGFSITAGQTLTEDFVLVSGGGSLTGTITRSGTSDPISGVTVDLIQGVVIVGSATTQANGSYEIIGIPPLPYTVRASAPGYCTVAQGVIINAGVTTTSDFALTTNTVVIQGTVSALNTGNPIPGTTVNFIQGATLMGSALTDVNGQYSIPTLAAGQYVVQAVATGYGTQNLGTTVSVGTPATVSFILSPYAGRVTGTVKDMSGNPIGGALVGAFQYSQIVTPTFTASDGTYTLTDIAPGSYSIRVRVEGYQTTFVGAIVEAGETIVVDFSLSSVIGNVMGYVQNSSLVRITGASIQVLQGTQPVKTVLTDTSGNYFVPNLAPGSYFISVNDQGYQSQIVGITVPAYPPNAEANFTMIEASSTASIQGHVNDASSLAPLPGALLEVLQEGTVITQMVANSEGAFSIFNLADGSYTIRASSSGYQTAVLGVIVSSASTATADFFLVFDAGSLEGTITDRATGLPIENAFVRIFFGDTPILSKLSDANGHYLFSNLTVGTYRVNVTTSGYQTSNQGAIIRNNQTTNLNIALSSGGGIIGGLVTDAGANAISGASVILMQSNNPIQRAVTSTDGRYYMTGVPSGDYEVRVTSSGFQTQIKGTQISEIVPTTLDFTLASDPGTIQGMVTDTTTPTPLPLAGAAIDVFQNSILFASTTSSTSGAYLVNGLPLGTYTVRVRLPSYQTALAITTLETVTPQTVNFALLPNPGSVIGTVTSATTGEPIQGALVVLEQKSIEITQVYTDGQGHYELTDLSLGASTMVVTAPGYQSFLQGADIISGEVLTNNFVLQPNPATIRGTVLDASTLLPAPNVMVTLLHDSVIYAFDMTDTDGTYFIPNMAPGSYAIRANGEGFQTHIETAILTAGQTTTVNFTLTHSVGSITGHVRNDVFVNLPGVTVHALQNNIVLAATLTDASGIYTLPDLAPGEYDVRAMLNGYCVGVLPATVVEGASTSVDFTLSSNPATIYGHVTDAFTGAVLPGVRVVAVQNGIIISLFFTDSNGLYSLINVPPGDYQLIATGPEMYQVSTLTVTVASGEALEQEISLQRDPGTISGYVQDAMTYQRLGNVLIDVLSGTTVVSSTLTDSSGVYVVPGLPPGFYTVRATLNTYQIDVEQATVQSNEITTVNFFLLKNSGSISGYVQDARNHQRLPNVHIDVLSGSILIASAWTNSSGAYTISNLPAGTFVVTATASNCYREGVRDVSIFVDQTTYVNFSLQRSSKMTGTVKNSITEETVSKAHIDVYVSGALIISTVTNSHGNYAINGLPRGEYLVTASKAGHYVSVSKYVKARPHKPTKVSFSLVPLPAAPRRVTGSLKTKHHRYLYKIHWKASRTDNVRKYVVYRDGKSIASVSKKKPLQYTDPHHRKRMHTYCVEAVDTRGEKSDRSCIGIK
jgi:protocatechuate 3,4-dioxygenase beta subunit